VGAARHPGLPRLGRLGRAGSPVVGFDLVEVSPVWDPSGRTGVTAAVLIREAILAWWGRAGEAAA
jgi:arginase family enzyme